MANPFIELVQSVLNLKRQGNDISPEVVQHIQDRFTLTYQADQQLRQRQANARQARREGRSQ